MVSIESRCHGGGQLPVHDKRGPPRPHPVRRREPRKISQRDRPGGDKGRKNGNNGTYDPPRTSLIVCIRSEVDLTNSASPVLQAYNRKWPASTSRKKDRAPAPMSFAASWAPS